MKTTILIASAGVSVLLGAGCGMEGPDEASLGSSRLAAITRNGITRNGITRNGITRNGITRNGLTSHGITRNGLHQRNFTSDSPEAALEFLTYTASCALSPDTFVDVTLNGTSYRLEGEMGLAPQWRGQACNASCQQWISACLLARTNFYGEHVTLSIRGPHDQLGSSTFERFQYSLQEGGFFGNLFMNPPRLYACMGSMFDNSGVGSAGAYLQRRICADESAEDCGFKVLGPCLNFVFPPWALGTENTCATEDEAGAFLQCRDALGTPGFPAGTKAYLPVVTTFLDPTTVPWWIPRELANNVWSGIAQPGVGSDSSVALDLDDANALVPADIPGLPPL